MYFLKAILTPIGTRQLGRYGLVFEHKTNHRHIGLTINDIQSWQWETNKLAEIKFIDQFKDDKVLFLQQSRRDYEVIKAFGMYLKSQNRGDEINHNSEIQGSLF